MNNKLKVSSLKRNHRLAKDWKSDLDYLLKESKFLHHLFDGYYLNFSSEYYLKQLRTIESALRALDQNIKGIAGLLEIQRNVIAHFITGCDENKSFQDAEMTKIGKSITDIHRKFRTIKEHLFQFFEKTEDMHQTMPFLDRSA